MVNLPQNFKVIRRNGASINSMAIAMDATTMVHRAAIPPKGSVVQYVSLSSATTLVSMSNDFILTTRQAINIPCNHYNHHVIAARVEYSQLTNMSSLIVMSTTEDTHKVVQAQGESALFFITASMITYSTCS